MRSYWACADVDNMWHDTDASRRTDAAYRAFFTAAFNESRSTHWAKVNKDGLTAHLVADVACCWDTLNGNQK